MKKILYSALCIALTLTGASCSKLLDIPQKGVLETDTFYSTNAECEEAAVAVYDAFASQIFNNGFYFETMLDDDTWAAGDNRGANVFLEQLNEFRFTSSLGSIESAFKCDYTIIYRANLIIHKVNPNTPEKKRVMAEAYFFRAYAYLDLVTIFGPAPLVVDLVEDGNYKVGNSTIEAIYTQIKEDLKAALELNALPEKAGLDDNITSIRVTKQTAQALLGKALVFNKEYAAAADMFENVITSEKYGLFQGEYGDILAVAPNNFNREIMLAVNKVADPLKYGFVAWNIFHGWRVDRLDGLATSNIDVVNTGWGFGVPTKSLYDAFVKEEGPDGYRLHQTICTYDRLVSEGITVVEGNFIYGCEGFLSWKFRNSKSSYIPGTFAGFYNSEVSMRYAEVLLLAAEANLMAGGRQAKADKYLNEVRKRAKLAPKSGITMEDIVVEKRLELCGENLRFKDLVRWGMAAEVLGKQGRNYPTFYGYKPGTTEYNVVYTNLGTDGGFKAGKHELCPFPQTELQVNSKLEQNKGWN